MFKKVPPLVFSDLTGVIAKPMIKLWENRAKSWVESGDNIIRI